MTSNLVDASLTRRELARRDLKQRIGAFYFITRNHQGAAKFQQVWDNESLSGLSTCCCENAPRAVRMSPQQESDVRKSRLFHSNGRMQALRDEEPCVIFRTSARLTKCLQRGRFCGNEDAQ